MRLLKGTKLLWLVLALSMVFPLAAIAAPVNEQVKYIYFENGSGDFVRVDYVQAIEAAINGDSVLYNSIKSYVGIAEGNGSKIVLETTLGTSLDYQKALVQNKPTLISIKDDPLFQITQPTFVEQLTVVGGVATIVPAVTPPAPSVTNDDTLNTVSGMADGMEYNLDGAGYITYNQATFDAISFAGNHTLLVRLAAGVNPASDVTTLVFTTNPVTPAAPAVTNDDSLNTVSGMASGMEYNLDNAGYVGYVQSTFDGINFSGNHTLLVRVAAAGINPASADTTLIFTSSINEAAEAAVAAYESGPIMTLAEIAIAEGLKPAADTAVAAVTDLVLQADFELRITTRATAIADAKSVLQLTETAAQAAAETAVAAYEAAPITNILQINTANGLKTTAEQAVGAVGDPTANSAFTARISARTTVVAIAEINLVSSTYSMGTSLRVRAAALGLDLTDYNALANNVPVQTALLAPTFLTAADIKTAFDTAVATQKAAESTVINAINNAANETEMAAAITTYATELQLVLTQYNALANKVPVQTALLGPTFTSGLEIKTAFVIAVLNNTNDAGVKTILYDNSVLLGLGLTSEYTLLSTRNTIENAVIAAKPIADKTEIVVTAFNSTVLSGYVGQLLPINETLLGLDLTDYNALIFRNKMKVHDAMLAATLTNLSELQTAFNAAVAIQTANEMTAVAAFNNAVNETEIATAITTYIDAADLSSYNGLANKVPVQTALLGMNFSTLAQVSTALNTQAAAQQALQTTAMSAVNTATAGTIDAVITSNASTLGLDLSDYSAFSTTDKVPVQTAMVTPTFYSISVLQSTFNAAVASQKAVVAVNEATTATMEAVLTTNAAALGLNINDYSALANKDSVNLALVGNAFPDKAAVQTAFETAVSIPAINAVLTAPAMATAITRYATVLGLNLTDYYGLSTFATSVQTALLAPTFANAAEFKTAFDAEVALAKVAKAVAAINSAATVTTMNSTLTTNAVVLGLSLTDYNALVNKVPVQTALLAPVFTTSAEIKAAFDSAVAVEEINEAAVNKMAALITKDAAALGLDLTDYSALINKESVYIALESPVFATALEVKTAFDTAVATQKAVEEPLLGIPSVKLNKPTTTIATGTSETLIATVLPADATNKDVTWASDNETVATVDINGTVTGIGAGTAGITATAVYGGYTDTCTVTVVVSATGVTLNKSSLIMLIGTNETLLATVLPADATNQNVTWASDRPAVASVDSSGKVTGVGQGIAAIIKVTTVDGNYSATCSVRAVTEATAANAITQAGFPQMAQTILDYASALGLVLTDYNALPSEGQSAVQSALLSPVFTTAAQVQAAFYAAVLANTPPPPVLVTGITIDPGLGGATVENGGFLGLMAIVDPVDATDQSVTWSIADGTGSATIDPDFGFIQPTAVGTVTVTATANDGSGVTGTLEITITAPALVPVTGITIDPGPGGAFVENGGILGLMAIVDPWDATDQSVTWSVTNGTGTATIDPGSGILSATGVGTVTVTATANDGSGVSGTLEITITAPALVPVTGITIDAGPGGATVENGGFLQLMATVDPFNATNPVVTWSVTNGTGTATIDPGSGILSATGVGTVTVTATATDGSGVTGTLEVTITAVP